MFERIKTKLNAREAWPESIISREEFERISSRAGGMEDDNGDIFISRHVSIPLNERIRRAATQSNAMVVGACGTGKTYIYLRENLLRNRNISYVVIDAGDLYNEMSASFERSGYIVKRFSLQRPCESDTFNPFAYGSRICENGEDRVLNTLFEYILKREKEKDENDPLYKGGLLLLLRSIDRYLREQDPDHYDLLGFADKLHDIPDDFNDEYFGEFNQLPSTDTRADILISTGIALQCCRSDFLRPALSGDSLELDKLSKRKQIVFIEPSVTSNMNNWIITLILEAAVAECMINANSYPAESGHKKVHYTHFMIDETQGQFLSYNIALGMITSQKANIWFSFLLQSMDQLKQMSEDWAMLIPASCGTHLLYGTPLADDVAWFAERMKDSRGNSIVTLETAWSNNEDCFIKLHCSGFTPAMKDKKK